MSYEMTVLAKEDYLHIRVSGKNTLQTVLEYTEGIYQECLQRNCWKVLVEENLEGEPLSMIDVYQATGAVSEHLKQPVMIAFVDVQPRSPNNLQFAEMVALNRGLNLRTFDDLQKAEAWIQEVSIPRASRTKT